MATHTNGVASAMENNEDDAAPENSMSRRILPAFAV